MQGTKNLSLIFLHHNCDKKETERNGELSRLHLQQTGKCNKTSGNEKSVL